MELFEIFGLQNITNCLVYRLISGWNFLICFETESKVGRNFQEKYS